MTQDVYVISCAGCGRYLNTTFYARIAGQEHYCVVCETVDPADRKAAVPVENKAMAPAKDKAAVRVTEAAAALASELGLSLDDIQGTGAHGRITKGDVLYYLGDTS